MQKETKTEISPKLLARAQRLIDRDDELIYDVASAQCQIVANVKHMRWFVEAIARELAE